MDVVELMLLLVLLAKGLAVTDGVWIACDAPLAVAVEVEAVVLAVVMEAEFVDNCKFL